MLSDVKTIVKKLSLEKLLWYVLSATLKIAAVLKIAQQIKLFI